MTGLKVTILPPRSFRSLSGWRKRGLLVPGFWPKKKNASVSARSSYTIVPTGEPMTLVRPTEVVSWHMFELWGRLLLP